MIERFNFYDLYGYAFPGIVLIGILAVPFILAHPPFSCTGTQAALAIAGIAFFGYIVGHLIQTFAAASIPSTPDRGASPFPYSTTVLNKSDLTFSSAFKGEIAARVKSWFGLEVDVQKDADRDLSSIRQDAFFMARHVVNASSSYGEQQQGMYVLMRGLCLACLLGAFYTAGWALSAIRESRLAPIGLIFFAISAALVVVASGRSVLLALWRSVFKQKTATEPSDPDAKRNYAVKSRKRKTLIERTTLFALAASLIPVGHFFGQHVPNESGMLSLESAPLSQAAVLELWALTFAYLIASGQFYGAYGIFAKGFAKTVWNHFGAELAERPKAT